MMIQSIDTTALPERYRPALSAYLERGDLPPFRLRRVLEGDVTAVRLFFEELPELLAFVEWLSRLPAQCWGSPDQVQLWSLYARRAHGRALLATFEETRHEGGGNRA